MLMCDIIKMSFYLRKGISMQIRKAAISDLKDILSIYAYARSFMREHGNAAQWAGGYPKEEILKDDIEKQKLHLLTQGEKKLAVFYCAIEEDPCYKVINGAWINDEPYCVVHRIASAKGTKGAATFCLNWAFEKLGHLRIDTHEDNIPMQNLLKKLGFTRCGIVWMQDGTERIAFEKVR